MKYICDNKRHLICIPYSVDNLHRMADDLGIKRCWFHKNHYDIPKKRIVEITKQCTLVSSKVIVDIVRSPDYAEVFLSDPIPNRMIKPHNQVSVEHMMLKYNGFSDENR